MSRYLVIVALSVTAGSAHADSSLCGSYSGLPVVEKQATPAGMVWVPAGRFIMGNDQGHRDGASGYFQPYPEEHKAHTVEVAGFYMDRHEVTNAQYQAFVHATDYQTLAERQPDPSWFPPGTPKAQQQSGSAVFVLPRLENGKMKTGGWTFTAGASWQHPEGPGSDITGRMNHPVVHIAHEDAEAYAVWAKRRLPTEAEWEYAARGAQLDGPYSWGKALKPAGKNMANTWQGHFPKLNSVEDGYAGTAPVGCFAANGFGLFDMSGNVWELVADAYRPGHQVGAFKPPLLSGAHVIKGGSYLCAPNYCMRYRPAARQPQDVTLGTSHVGFRTVLSSTESLRTNSGQQAD